ncbi:MAG: hypothetical protein LBH25_01220 [Fibromonadaceae bacterium]|jgi:hypothetical protein|nr:hypothetical protein [Fibromonadaceae bacterium]
MNKVHIKGKRFFATTLAASIVLAMVFTLIGCDGGKSALVGRWESTEGNMELLSDGTGIASMGSKLVGFTWKTESDRFYVITSSANVKSSNYKVQGSMLTFTDDNGDVEKFSRSESNSDFAYFRYMNYSNEIASYTDKFKSDLLSARCLEN